MCGIAGKLNFNRHNIRPEEISAMTDAIAHRGPDDAGILVKNNIGLGQRRLSIIDLSPAGHQPMSDAEQTIWITFNGEIYNFLELRQQLEKEGIKFQSKTDTEVVIYLYKKYGEDCLKYLRGMFAFAIWDEGKQQLFLARDRIGQKPLKYYCDSDTFIFASELKAILKNSEVKKEIDWPAIDEYLTYQYIPHPKTGFKNIFKLEQAHYLIVKKTGEIIKKRYWQLDFSQKLNLSETEWEKKITNKLKESIKLRLISDVPLGAHLSGGIDSGLIVALMAEKSSKAIKTYSIGFKENKFNELPYAKMVAERYRTDHHEFIVEPNAVEILPKLAYHYEEPYADSSALPTWYLSEITKQNVTVALNGDGGDENFAGYNRYHAVKLFSQLKNLPGKKLLAAVNRIIGQATGIKIFQQAGRFFDVYAKNLLDLHLNISQYLTPKNKKIIYQEKIKEEVKSSRWRAFAEEKMAEFEKNNPNNASLLDKIAYTDINSYLPDDLLVKVDIASMAHGLEVRSPFLDNEFLALTAQMPADLKIKGHNKKYLLKQIAYKYLPKQCIDRRKQGFSIPLQHWFRGDLNKYLAGNLLDEKFLNYGFNKEGIKQLLVQKQGEHSRKLWALLMLKHWLDAYFA